MAHAGTSNAKAKERALATLTSVQQVQQPWLAMWADLRDFMMPRHGRNLTGEEPNNSRRGEKKHQKIFDATHLRSVSNMAAGMHSGLTSPNRPWFKYGFTDQSLMELDDVAQWLHDVEEQVYSVLSGSNVYEVLHSGYGELGVFGTSVSMITEDFESIIRGRALTIGECALITDSSDRVSGLVLTRYFTAPQMVDEFGRENVEDDIVKNADEGQHSTSYTVYQLIEPRDEHNDLTGVRGRDFVSLWFMKQETIKNDGFLRVSGYHERPFLAPRWHTVADDPYGESAGMDVLADVQTAQQIAKTSLAALHKEVDPPLTAPGSMRGTGISTVPGGVNFVDGNRDAQNGLRPLYEVRANLAAADAKLDRLQRLIAEGMFADLFRMLQFADRGQMTATEVAERQQEKLLLLGPVLERVHSEMLGPLLDRIFGILNRNGMLPEPPEAIEGHLLEVSYISILAQAQKLAGVAAIQQLAGFVASIAQVKPEVLDLYNADEAVREFAEKLGVNPKQVNSREFAAQVREQRAQQEAQQRQAQMAMTAADGAKTLSETPMDNNSALSLIADRVGAA